MAYTNEAIIVGAADVFVGRALDLPLPDRVPGETFSFTLQELERTTPAEERPAWRHVGLTQGGVELAYAPDFGEVDVDQYLDVAKMFKQRQSVTVNTTLAQATLDNLLFAWGQPDYTLNPEFNADDSLNTEAENDPYDLEGENDMIIHGGSLGDKPVERPLVFIGPAPGKVRKERIYHLARTLNVESSSHTLSKTEASVIPVAMRCLPAQHDTSGAVEYGRIIERVISA